MKKELFNIKNGFILVFAIILSVFLLSCERNNLLEETNIPGGGNTSNDETAPAISWPGTSSIENNSSLLVSFSESVVNADNVSNYQASVSGSGGGTADIVSVAYNASTKEALLTVVLSGANTGDQVTINTVESSNSIKDAAGNVLSNSRSNVYTVPDNSTGPTITSWEPLTGTVKNGEIVTVSFSKSVNTENVEKADNYVITPGTYVSVGSISYDYFSKKAYLTILVNSSVPDSHTFSVGTTTSASPITDSSGNNLVNSTSSLLTAANDGSLVVSGWTASRTEIEDGETVEITFSEKVDKDTAENLDNYNLSGWGLKITEASANVGQQTVALKVEKSGSYFKYFKIETKSSDSPIKSHDDGAALSVMSESPYYEFKD
ncbi:MAG: hypothetical protein GY754_45220 [bacterium]|nr:hypothetical protein [bacterium]